MVINCSTSMPRVSRSSFFFRDSTQFTGLLDCQARAASALDCHFNASLATLNLVRAADLGMQQGEERPWRLPEGRRHRAALLEGAAACGQQMDPTDSSMASGAEAVRDAVRGTGTQVQKVTQLS